MTAVVAGTITQHQIGAWKLLDVQTNATEDGAILDLSSYYGKRCWALISGTGEGVTVAKIATTGTNVTIRGGTNSTIRRMLTIGY